MMIKNVCFLFPFSFLSFFIFPFSAFGSIIKNCDEIPQQVTLDCGDGREQYILLADEEMVFNREENLCTAIVGQMKIKMTVNSNAMIRNGQFVFY